MNETSTTSSSSTAAAASDSASAAANITKTASAAGAAAAAATSVKLLIKASNQQFDDQIVESDLLWTVKRLKTQLSLVYPSKPAVSDQKLIYSGQLLSDGLLLKDVIRSYKDVHTQNHIFHLVCASKNMPSPTSVQQKPKIYTAVANTGLNTSSMLANSTTDGLRYRNANGNEAQQQPVLSHHHQQQQQQQLQQQQQNINNNPLFNSQFIPQMMAVTAGNAAPQCPNFTPNTPFSFPGQFNMQSFATQQAAMYNWMQQVYSQYMDQCIRLSNSAAGIPTVSPTGSSSPNNFSAFSAQFSANPFLQPIPFMSASTNPTTNFGVFAGAPSNATVAGGVSTFHAGTATPVIQFPNSATPEAAVAATTASAPAPQNDIAEQGGAAGAVGDNQAAAAAQQQLPRFPNIVQDENDNHDWLDSFFSLTRLAIFLTILFFNTSPLRCLIVVMIAGGIYLYHTGVFRTRAERNNNNINRNNNVADVANQIRQGVQEIQQAQQAQPRQQQEQQVENNPPNPEAQRDEARPDEQANHNAISSADPLLNGNTATGAADENAAEDNQTASVTSFIRTFVVSFFTSLLPETPAL